MNKRPLLFFIIFVFLAWGAYIFAGTTGKISGVVKDADNGAPLAGVNVIIEGTTMGAATDVNGFYFVINIPPGTYTVKASMMGYEIQNKVGVKVVTDITTKVDFKLRATVVEGEMVTVVADRPAIQKDLTSSLQAFAGDEIAASPV